MALGVKSMKPEGWDSQEFRKSILLLNFEKQSIPGLWGLQGLRFRVEG